jgi:hypothetical protein
MADSVDSLRLAVAGERPNIFAAPDGAAQVTDMAVAGAQPSSVFIARDSSDRRREASVGARRPVARGLSLRTSVCIAAVIAAGMAVVVLREIGAEGGHALDRVAERPARTARTVPTPARESKRIPPRRQLQAPPRPRGRSRTGSAQRRSRRAGDAGEPGTCCARRPSARRSGSSALRHIRPAAPATAAPAIPDPPAPVPRQRVAPAPVPAGSPAEFM